MNKIILLKTFKVLKILLLVVYVPVLLFYLLMIVPEYLACINCVYEGEMGKDIWGREVQCYGESKAIGEAFFQMFSLIVGTISVLLLIVFYLNHQLVKSLQKNPMANL